MTDIPESCKEGHDFQPRHDEIPQQIRTEYNMSGVLNIDWRDKWEIATKKIWVADVCRKCGLLRRVTR